MAGRIQRRRVAAPLGVVATTILLAGCASAQPPQQDAAGASALPHITESITENSLKAHLSFLASDALEGRGTPSRGLNIAAEYIAAQFRGMGLEPVRNDRYFQTVTLEDLGERGAQLRRRYALSGAPDYMHNVGGILRGSDPELADTYIIVSAHYDHVGLADTGSDRIYNGANDDGSGTSSVLAIAEALSSLPEPPRRSVLFLLFFGEERGLLGSLYYGDHPLVPLNKTIAGINLEHMGRTDMDGGTIERAANVTGFDFSTLTATIVEAAAIAGIEITKNQQYSDQFFNQSDNRSLAMAGVPAHTVSVGYLFPDYHQPSDHWEKIDYANMAAVDRGIALAIVRLAESDQAPEWNASLPAAAGYREAAETLYSEQ